MFEKAKRYLEIYYKQVKDRIPEYKTFDDFIYHYRVDHYLLENYGELVEHNDFLESFDKALDNASHEDIINAMNVLASQTNDNKVPTNQDFFNVLINEFHKNYSNQNIFVSYFGWNNFYDLVSFTLLRQSFSWR